MKNYLYIILLLLTVKISPQNFIEKQYLYADSLYKSENYFEAITEYKRLLFFDNDNHYSFDANYKIGLSYKAGGYFENAINFIRAAQKNLRNEDDYYNTEISIARINLLRNHPEITMSILKKMIISGKFINKENELLYWQGWGLMIQNKWETAAEYFRTEYKDSILSKFCTDVDKKLFSVNKAKILSIILPGAGQFYTKEYINGTLSLAWNVFAGYLTVNSFVKERVWDGLAAGNLLWLRFYRGGIENASNFADNKNKIIYNEALNYLFHQYTGIKP